MNERFPRISGRAAIAKLITVPIVWFVLPSLPLGAVLVVVIFGIISIL